ncbi:MAG: efflux RND transporter permease subunit [Pararhodobacter sp.]|nr:efflux RND transporter permease subunit [Pararhodobacter sp.]
MSRARFLKITAHGLFRYFTRHRTAANLLLVLMLAGGLFAAPRMHAQFFPDIVVDNVSVVVAWPGAGAEDVDRGVLQLLEPAMMTVEGVAGTSATASDGRARISLEFEPGWDMARAAADVQEALDLITTLPEDAEEPRIARSSWGDRVTNVVITGPVAVDQLARFADEFAARLYDAGITRTTIQGIASPEITVEVPSLRLVQHDITMAQIAQAIASASAVDPAGELSGGAFRVRTGTERRTAEEIGAVVLRTQPDGTALTVADLATVQTGAIDRNRAYWIGDTQAITLRVERSQTGDAIAIQNDVQRIADDMALTLPEGMRIELTSARADMIAGRLALLVTNGLMGLGLVVLLLFLFLNARTAFWVAAGIPVAMLAAIGMMYLAGMSFNMISLFALIITLGIVVDDAIVVGEHADYRFRTLGEAPAEAAENAATRMALPVFAASITTITAFAGLIVIGGRFGSMIADIPWTVILVLIASLIECFLILPNHMHHALVGAAKEHWYDWPSRQVNRGFDWVRERAFRPAMRVVLAGRYVVLAGLVLLLAVQVSSILRGDVPWRFFVQPEQGTLSGNYLMSADATRADSLAMMRELQRAADALATRLEAEHGTWPIVSAVAEIGGNAGRALAGAGTRSSDLAGAITIDLIDADFRPYSSFEFTAMLQEEVGRPAMLDELSFRSFGMGPGGDSLSVDIFGADTETLKAAAEALKAQLAVYPDVTGLEDTLAYDKEELILTLTPQGQALGFSTDTLGRELRQRLTGIEAATFPEGVRSGAIRVELPEHERVGDFLENTLLRSASGRYLPLGDIVRIEARQGFSTIQRENGVRLVTVSGSISEDDAQAARAVNEALQFSLLPQLQEEFGVTTRLSGLAQQEQEFLSDALLGLIACLMIIYATLTWIFSSWFRPLVVMAVIPFGLIGVIYGHASWGMALSMFSVVGMLGMAGIIINDSIVLVTTVDQYERERGLIPSIVDAAADRLRPVMLTTLTTVLGLGPLLFERSSDAQFLKPTVVTLVYGLGFGMVLVLLIVPALLAVGHDMSRMTRSLRRALRLPKAQVGAAVRVVPGLAVALVLAIFAATLGWTVATGAQGPLTALIWPDAGAALVPALGVFAGLAAGVVLVIWAMGTATMALSPGGNGARTR